MLLNEGVTAAGSIASLISLAVSLYVAFAVRTIRRGFLLKARIPDLVRRLNSEKRKLLKSMESFDESSHEVFAILAGLVPIIESIEKKLKGPSKRGCKELLRDMRAASSKADLYNVYNRLLTILNALSELKRDMQWSDRP